MLGHTALGGESRTSPVKQRRLVKCTVPRPLGGQGAPYTVVFQRLCFPTHPPTQGVSLGAPEGPQAVGQRNESAVSLVRFPWQPIICDLLMYPIGTAAGSGKGGLTVEISGSQNS